MADKTETGAPPAETAAPKPATETSTEPGPPPDSLPQPYFPDGLSDSYRGKTERDTIDNLAAVIKTQRERDSARDVPKEAEGYLSVADLKDFELSDDLKPHYEAMNEDKALLAAATEAKKAGVDRGDFHRMLSAAMKAAADAGMLEPPLDLEAEKAALVPDAHKNAPAQVRETEAEKRMNANFAFMELMSANRNLDKDVGEFAQNMLGDTALGHRFMEWLRGAVGGETEQAGALAGSGDGGTGDPRDLLKRPEGMPGHPNFDPRHEAAVDEAYKKKYGS